MTKPCGPTAPLRPLPLAPAHGQPYPLPLSTIFDRELEHIHVSLAWEPASPPPPPPPFTEDDSVDMWCGLHSPTLLPHLCSWGCA